jgi:ketosteroid isomerase-like protein
VYDAWNRDDFEGFVDMLHPDVEWHSSGVFPGLEPVYRGREGVRRWWHAIRDPFERFTIEVEEVREAGGATVASVRFRAVGKGSGARVDLPFAHVFEFEDARVVRYWAYDSVDTALAARRG